MCVLCKFYGQHRFHKCELLSKVASKYCSSVSEKLRKLEGAEKDLDASAQLLSQSVEEIDSSARKAQERLERHFAGEQIHSSDSSQVTLRIMCAYIWYADSNHGEI